MRPCVFLDRDGVINEKPAEGEYVTRWDEFRVIPGIVDWVRLFNALGYLVIVVTNQRGIARGKVEREEVDRIHRRMVDELAALGARIDDVFCCPHEIGTCGCRKPEPGLIVAAQRHWDIDLHRSIMVGDSESDRLLAGACGLTFIETSGGRVVDVAAFATRASVAGDVDNGAPVPMRLSSEVRVPR